MTNNISPVETLQHHRPLLLAMEAIGWFHMAGKARAKFLRRHGGENNGYNERQWHNQETPPFPWDDLLGWVQQQYGANVLNNAWPNTFAAFTKQHAGRNAGMLGLIQAGHGIVSGIEKNLPSSTSGYLAQSIPHMWLSSPWGHPKRNLLADPSEILTPQGWQQLVAEIRRVLEELRDLGTRNVQAVASWRSWRESAIGDEAFIRRAFLSTLAETRLPNNDVTLWDQSYVAAALFKSAVAGALLNTSFPWNDDGIKQKIRWRLLTVAIGTEHYEARSVKIGDWTGAQGDIDEFFQRVAKLVEVDLAAGSLLYRDNSVAVFSFPGERFDEEEQELQKRQDPNFKFDETNYAGWLQGWKKFEDQVDEIARNLDLETPPHVCLSGPTRSLVPMVEQWQKAKRVVAVPFHKPWDVRWQTTSQVCGHVCPVCGVRFNDDSTNKGKPCADCRKRRHHRRDAWLQGQLGNDTIWFEEVADRNGRLALLTFSLDLKDWLNGERVDSLRAQSIPEWVRFNPVLEKFWERNESNRQRADNPIAPSDLASQLIIEIRQRFRDASGNWRFPKEDLLLANLQEGVRHFRSLNQNNNEPQEDDEERLWRIFYEQIVEDRADAPKWNALDDNQRAAWLVHQFFRKLPSPGRVYRFWREAEGFFRELLKEFRQIAARTDNPWRVRRLVLVPENRNSFNDRNGMLYNGRLDGKPISLVYVDSLEGFVTAFNMAQVLSPEEGPMALKGKMIELEEEDTTGQPQTITITRADELRHHYAKLGVYHPVIPIEISPLCFRVLVPLEAASVCVDLAVAWWRECFARVWDRLPLQVGVIAFPRLVPYQAVVEAVRNMEDALTPSEETWCVQRVQRWEGMVVLGLRGSGGHETIRVMPVHLPDGREDVFYPYLAVEDHQLRFPRDFQHPDGQVYRHAADLRLGDGIKVAVAQVKTIFMDSTAARFDTTPPWHLEEWTRMREVWALLQRVTPSQTALQHLRSELVRLKKDWRSPPDCEEPSSDLWRETLRALIIHHLNVQGVALETLIEAAMDGILQWAMDWHMTVLKENM